MNHRGVRVGLAVLVAAIMGAAGCQIVLTQRRIATERSAARAFDELARTLAITLGDLRAAQQAYVASGQDGAYWIGQVASHLDTVNTNLASLKQLSTAPRTVSELDAAVGAIENFGQMDARARDYAVDGQLLLASDLIFTDGRELAAAAARHVDVARERERDTRDRALVQQRRSQALAFTAAAGTGLLVVGLLVLAARSRTGPTARAGSDASPLGDLELDSGWSAPGEAERAAETGTAPGQPAADQRDVRMPDLRAAADLCMDLGRLCDARELPAWLERAAQLLNASGITIWLADPGGRELRPALGHGYSPQALSRMGSISRDDDNATAAAYRAAEMQIVTGEGGLSGAIVAPLITAASCVGVMAAEVRNGWESREAVCAIAAILAAQLATLVAAAPPAQAAHAQG